MLIIKPPMSNSDDLRSQLKCLMETKKMLEAVSPNETVELDLSNMKWASPIFITPLVSTLERLKPILEQAAFKIKYPYSDSIASYLQKIGFPGGIDIADVTPHDTLFPLIRINSTQETQLDNLRQIICSHFPGHENALIFLIQEMVDNVHQHSLSSSAFIMGQYYKTKKFLDVCIVDTGIGIKESYIKADIPVTDDEDALKKAYSGHSTKQEYGQYSRGYGIPSSARLTAEGYEGDFILISNNGGLSINSRSELNGTFSLGKHSWRGTMVTARFKLNRPPIDIYQFMEKRCIL